MLFYDLTDLMDPKMIGSHEIKFGMFFVACIRFEWSLACFFKLYVSENVKMEAFEGYVGHGMCLLSNESNLIKILLFGGLDYKPFAKSFNEFTIAIKFDTKNTNLSVINEDNFDDHFNIKQKRIKNIRFDERSRFVKQRYLAEFGFEMISNDKMEQIIVIIGGWHNTQNIITFNYDTKRIVSIDNNVKFFFLSLQCFSS